MFPYLPVDRVKATYHLPLQKIAVSSYIAEAIRDLGETENIFVVPNGIRIEDFTVPLRKKGPSPVFGFLYASTPRKAVARAIDSLVVAKASVPELTAVAFGNSAIHSNHVLPDWVEYHQSPEQRSIPELYARCDGWLFSSDSEGFGLPILEAMACRTPVIATRAGAAPELVNDGNGALVAFDAADIAAQIVALCNLSDQRWQAKSDAAYATAQHHTWEKATDRLLTLLTDPPD